MPKYYSTRMAGTDYKLKSQRCVRFHHLRRSHSRCETTFETILTSIILLFIQMKLVTPSALVERLKINSSLARAACKFLAEVRLEPQLSQSTYDILGSSPMHNSNDTHSSSLLNIFRRAKLP